MNRLNPKIENEMILTFLVKTCRVFPQESHTFISVAPESPETFLLSGFLGKQQQQQPLMSHAGSLGFPGKEFRLRGLSWSQGGCSFAQKRKKKEGRRKKEKGIEPLEPPEVEVELDQKRQETMARQRMAPKK